MSHAQFTIRSARAADLPALSGLLGLLFAVERDFAIDSERQERGLEMLLASPNARLLVAEAQGAALGMVAGQLVVSTAEGAWSLWAEDLVVAPQWRGRGVGSGLMWALAAWARARGATRMQLLADRGNDKGLDFHHRLGWENTRMICLRKKAT
ncbi:MAG: GNAT family N-acetyltransferase [Desulfarculaceae bacterium]|nr:GNAT family N-acetyltransferase [Desulfarculaceae bacterium]MCF8071129.1 GNAT family N-acetyltransferase [Desulfarculaceae bacterium]MCF8101268.1 GNAT family N-acetyltransferase [Desulfarculaceae bacterium]MCF8115183.1 GNAT family N-acetyltransferase [Desulfarculaceae bacterium]